MFETLWRVRPVPLAVAACVGLPWPTLLSAQEALDRRVSATVSPTLQSWRFGDGIRQDGVQVTSAQQITVPLAVRWRVGDRLSVEATSAFMQASIAGRDSASGEARTRRLSGPTDTRLRATWRLPVGGMALTTGLNLPTGKTALDDEGLAVLRTIGAPVLRAPAPAPGVGFGGTVGVILARQVGEWAIGGAASYEHRAAYTPFEMGLTGTSPELRPGAAVHVSLGADGQIGAHRLGVLTLVDLFGEDELDGRLVDDTPFTSRYQLGPQVSTALSLDIATTRARSLRLSLAHRWRDRFTGADGAQVAGSAQQALEANVDAVLGAPDRTGLVLGAEVRYASRLDLEPAFVTAGVTGAGVRVGVVRRTERLLVEPRLQAFVGSLSVRDASPTMTSYAVTLTLSRP